MYLHTLNGCSAKRKSPPYGETEGKVWVSEDTLKMEDNVTYWQSVSHWGVEGELARVSVLEVEKERTERRDLEDYHRGNKKMLDLAKQRQRRGEERKKKKREEKRRGTQRRKDCNWVFLSQSAPAATSWPDGSRAESRFCGKVVPLRLMSMTLLHQVFVTYVTVLRSGYSSETETCSPM